MDIKRHIPNTITSLNLFAGCVAAVLAFQGDFVITALLVYLASLFDFLDGFAARALKAYSAIGKELDSLADMVSFGFVPAIVVFVMLKNGLTDSPFSHIIPYTAFLLAVFSGLRLAIFNIDDRQTVSFIGLPTPANGLFWVSFAAWYQQSNLSNLQPGVLLVFVALFSFLLVSSLPMFSLKIKNLSFKENALPFLLLISGLGLIIFYGYLGVSLSIGIYIISSLFVKIIKR
ncbi:MAG: CDP-alcohol phosphatidyltransferase family protein [Bacteroidales bacterium]|nr:CDP-alcohol phosphatidyltransferase family protein [Bacteroidales bacterium]